MCKFFFCKTYYRTTTNHRFFLKLPPTPLRFCCCGLLTSLPFWISRGIKTHHDSSLAHENKNRISRFGKYSNQRLSSEGVSPNGNEIEIKHIFSLSLVSKRYVSVLGIYLNNHRSKTWRTTRFIWILWYKNVYKLIVCLRGGSLACVCGKCRFQPVVVHEDVLCATRESSTKWLFEFSANKPPEDVDCKTVERIS